LQLQLQVAGVAVAAAAAVCVALSDVLKVDSVCHIVNAFRH